MDPNIELDYQSKPCQAQLLFANLAYEFEGKYHLQLKAMVDDIRNIPDPIDVAIYRVCESVFYGDTYVKYEKLLAIHSLHGLLALYLHQNGPPIIKLIIETLNNFVENKLLEECMKKDDKKGAKMENPLYQRTFQSTIRKLESGKDQKLEKNMMCRHILDQLRVQQL